MSTGKLIGDLYEIKSDLYEIKKDGYTGIVKFADNVEGKKVSIDEGTTGIILILDRENQKITVGMLPEGLSTAPGYETKIDVESYSVIQALVNDLRLLEDTHSPLPEDIVLPGDNEEEISSQVDEMTSVEDWKNLPDAYAKPVSAQLAIMKDNIMLLDEKLEGIDSYVGELEERVEQLEDTKDEPAEDPSDSKNNYKDELNKAIDQGPDGGDLASYLRWIKKLENTIEDEEGEEE